MNKLHRNIILGITSVVILTVFLTSLLYSTLCRFEKIIDWNAINAIASIIMAIITICAVYVAIYIPKQDRIIASKIELFEYRFQLYYAVERSFISIYLQDEDMIIESGVNRDLMRMQFLINKNDKDKVLALYNSIKTKAKDKVNGDSQIEEIHPELRELVNIFDKYINLNEYGISEID